MNLGERIKILVGIMSGAPEVSYEQRWGRIIAELEGLMAYAKQQRKKHQRQCWLIGGRLSEVLKNGPTFETHDNEITTQHYIIDEVFSIAYQPFGGVWWCYADEDPTCRAELCYGHVGDSEILEMIKTADERRTESRGRWFK